MFPFASGSSSLHPSLFPTSHPFPSSSPPLPSSLPSCSSSFVPQLCGSQVEPRDLMQGS